MRERVYELSRTTSPIDLEIIVYQDVTHSRNPSPRHLRMRVLKRPGDAPSSFADDLNVTKDVGSNELIGVEFEETLEPVSDCPTFVDPRFSRRELNPFVGISLDRTTAAQMA